MTDERNDTDADRVERRTVLAGLGTTVGAGFLRSPLPGPGETAGSASGETTMSASGNTPDQPAVDTGSEETNTDPAGNLPARPTVGANVNAFPRLLDHNMNLVDASDTTWIRAVFDIRRKNRNGTHPKNDPDVEALRRVAREKNCKLIVTLLWDFKGLFGTKSTTNVPDPHSRREVNLRQCATRYLRHLNVPVDVVVLGNEPMWETKREDVRTENPPIARFTRNVKDHLVRHGDHGDPVYLVGSLNRLDDDVVREEQYPEFFGRMFGMARNDDDVAGVDLHLHYGRHREARRMVEIARDRLSDGVLTATEFSPVYRYWENTTKEIRSWKAGRQFLRQYDHPRDWTSLEYIEFAKNNPRPRSEVGDFYKAMPWYHVDHLRKNRRLFERFDVRLSTLGFVLGPGMRDTDWGPNWRPYPINHLFQGALIDGRGDHPHFIDEYRNWA